ncbi:hypothetical protein Tco_0605388, partial [Tanacetum coccineum]
VHHQTISILVAVTIPANITVLGFGTKNVSRIIQEMPVPNSIVAVWWAALCHGEEDYSLLDRFPEYSELPLRICSS